MNLLLLRSECGTAVPVSAVKMCLLGYVWHWHTFHLTGKGLTLVSSVLQGDYADKYADAAAAQQVCLAYSYWLLLAMVKTNVCQTKVDTHMCPGIEVS